MTLHLHPVILSLWLIPLFALMQRNTIMDSLRIPAESSKLTALSLLTSYNEVSICSNTGVDFMDITKLVKEKISSCQLREGQVNIISKHTTTAIIINEMESRLVDDHRQFLLKLAPAGYPYLHNDIHLRNCPEGWSFTILRCTHSL